MLTSSSFRRVLGLAVLCCAQLAQGCVYLCGNSPNSLAPKTAATSWNYGFRGDDWTGVDATNKTWVCKTGKKQSPLNLETSTDCKSPRKLRTQWFYRPAKSNGTNIQVYNTGHTIQVQWAAGTLSSNVLVKTAGKNVTDVLSMSCHEPTKTVAATPLQFHFHTDSEHAVDGIFYPMEMHIVHVIPQSELASCPATGCLMVTGILFKLDPEDKENPYLKAIWDVMPMREGLMVDMPKGATVNIQGMLPKPMSYHQYEGSLTTPPCTEGLLWHVFTEPQTMSLDQLRKYAMAVGNKDCELKSPGRRLHADHDHGHDHHDHAHANAAPNGFVRGSYTGFVKVPVADIMRTNRKLQAAAGVTNPDAYTCKIVSFGYTNRWPQPLNNRPVLTF